MRVTLLIKWAIVAIAIIPMFAAGQTAGITTYLNPVQPGDHPDQTLMKVGNDFYTTGSSFHFTPYVPIYHSTDLVHWEIIARVVVPGASGVNDGAAAGIWQGALAQFGGYFWVYYSINSGQHFSKATSMAGPWSAPTRVTASTVTGYDNSIFVDDDGTPYMLMKNGEYVNRIQQIDKTTGQLTGTLMNCDWINATKQYSWAEGPVMCKRNGRYYYFVAGNVGGGQYVLSTTKLSADETYWTRHGNFFTAATNPSGLSSPNHITQPIQLEDGTWWCLSHSYDNSGWQGQGRISCLHQVIWDANGVPHASLPSKNPAQGPNLPNDKNIPMNLPREDYFTATTLDLDWHFLNKTTAAKYSLTAAPGYMRLNPGSAATTHVLQKEGGHNYTAVTKVVVNATANGQIAGLRLTNGKDDLFINLYSGYNSGAKKIGISFNGSTTEVNNTIGNTVWLKLDRVEHTFKGYFSGDGKTWTQVGGSIDVSALDKFSDNGYNSWVGNSLGLFATNITADFDFFKYRDGFHAQRAAGYNNYNGVSTSTKTPGSVATSSTSGGWLMLAGVSMSDNTTSATTIVANAASASGGGSLEVWIDNINGAGTKIATIPIAATGGADVWKDFSASVNVKGQHDLYLKFVGAAGVFSLNTVRFQVDEGAPTVSITAPANNAVYSPNSTVSIAATAADADGTISKVDFYQGTSLISSDNSSPYTATFTPTAAGTYSLTAVATDNSGKTATSAAVSIVVKAPQAPYGGTAWPIPGKIEFENFDEGGQDSAYNDLSAGSASASTFRLGTDVDIETCTDAGTGFNVGYATAGEWLEYTVNVAAAGKYDLTLRVACNGDGRTVSISAKDVVIAKDIAIPNTAGWQTWQDVKVTGIQLSAGVQVIRVTMGATDYVNMNYMTFAAQTLPKQSVSLKKGWNLVGYPYLGSADVSTALSSIWPNVSVVKDIDSFYEKAGQAALNSLSKVSFGKGYYVKVSADCELTW